VHPFNSSEPHWFLRTAAACPKAQGLTANEPFAVTHRKRGGERSRGGARPSQPTIALHARPLAQEFRHLGLLDQLAPRLRQRELALHDFYLLALPPQLVEVQISPVALGRRVDVG
jgi:hypothetical protein